MEQHNIHDTGSQNQTGSTNESRDEHDTGVSSPSAPRGFSSDEGSGWRSETETSDGNFSLSQYPLDDRSGEESTHDNGSVHDEALSSLIKEVSKDFLSGNYIPLKCPSASGDSDSYSDGDHKATGAVYANYPESATGMSDCDWNPYESDNNDNKMPRIQVSEGPVRNPLLDTMSTAHNRQMKDSGFGSYESATGTGNAEGGGNSTGTENGKSSNNKGAQGHSVVTTKPLNQDRDYRQPVPLMTTQQFYALYSPNHQILSDQSRDEGTHSPNLRLTTQERNEKPANHARRDSGESLPALNEQGKKEVGKGSETSKTRENEAVLFLRNGQNQMNGIQGATTERRRSSDNDDTRRAVESLQGLQSALSNGSSQNVRQHEAGSSTQSISEGSVRVGSQGASATAVQKRANLSVDHLSGSRTASSDTNQQVSASDSYMNVQEREKLLGLPPGSLTEESISNSPYEQMARELMDEAESDVKTAIPNNAQNGDKTAKPDSTEYNKAANNCKQPASLAPAGDVQSQGDRAVPPLQDALSKRVAKLLEDASTLGASLHKQLYSREALGLDNDSNYQLYTPNKSEDSGSAVLGGCSLSRSLDGGDGSRQQPKTLSLLNENLSKSGKSDYSVTSSLSEEVAKLMARNEQPGYDYQSKMDGKFSSKPPRNGFDSFSHTAEMESLEKYYAQERETERLLEETRARLSSGHDTDMPDPLGLRVQKVLKETTHVNDMNGQPAEPRLDSVPYNSDIPSSLDYSRIQKDLQEIQNSLSNQDNYNDGKLPTQFLLNKSPTQDISLCSDKSGETDVESARNRKLLWDHGADFGINSSATGGFVGTMKTDYAETSTERENSLTPKTIPTAPVIEDLADDVGYSSDTQERKPCEDNGLVHEVIGDQLNSESEDNEGHSRLAPDVEEIIQRYQKHDKQESKMQKELDQDKDTTGLASRVFDILTKEPPQKQVYGILESAMEQEREMMQRIVNRPKMDSSYDSYGTPDGSFIIRDKDIKKQLDWSGMSSMDVGHSEHPDKTGISEWSFLKEGKHAPFNALGSAKHFLSSQLQKNSERTFNHSIELRTPCRNIIECYPVYGVEKGPQGETTERKEPEGTKEAWVDTRVPQRDERSDEEYRRRPRTPDRGRRNNGELETVTPRLASERFFLTDLDSTPLYQYRERHRRLSDPRDLSPDFRTSSPDRDRHIHSRSEEATSLNMDTMAELEPTSSNTSRQSSSSPRGKDPSRRQQRTDGDRQETYGGNSSPVRRKKRRDRDRRRYACREQSNSSSGGVVSPNDTRSSSRRSGTSRLRPYRPYGSKELYYTDSPEDTGSIVDSVTTVESSHTADNSTMESTHSDFKYFYPSRTNLDYVYGDSDRYRHDDIFGDFREKYDYLCRGSDDAVPPSFPSQCLGTRSDLPSSLGIYSNHPKSDGLSTIEEKSVVTDDRERSGTDSGVDRKSADLESNSSKGERDDLPSSLATDRRPDRGLSMDVLRGQRDGAYGSRLERPLGDKYQSDKLQYTGHRGSSLDQHELALDKNTAVATRQGTTLNPGPGTREPYIFDRAPQTGSIELKDDQFSNTARSDPGEQYTTPSHIPRDQEFNSLEYPHSHHAGHRDLLHEGIGPLKSRSKSETDLIEISMEEHKNSSPMYGKGRRLMDLSCQPSPIFSHHTSLNSPAVTTGRVNASPHEDRALIDKYITERIMHRPLDKGPDASDSTRQSDRLAGFYQEIETARPQVERPDDIYTSGTSEGRTPEYRSHAVRNFQQEPSRYTSNPGHMLKDYKVPSSAAYCDKTGKPLDENPVSSAAPVRVDQFRSNSNIELPRSNFDLVRPLEPGLGLEARPLDPGPLRRARDPVGLANAMDTFDLIARPLEPGPDYDTTSMDPLPSQEKFLELEDYQRSGINDRPHPVGWIEPSAEDGEFKELIPDFDFEVTVMEEREKLRQQKQEELLREVQAKARRNHGKIVSAEEESEFGAELDRIPPSKKAQVLRETLEKEYRPALHPNINEMWQRFQDLNQGNSDSSLDTSRIETLTKLLQNPTRHVVQKYMDDRTYEKVKEKQLLEELAKCDRERSREEAEKQRKVVDSRRRQRDSDHRQTLSEEEINGSYGEILARNEQRKKLEMDKNKKEKDNKNKGSQSRVPRMENSAETLFSIPEDSSFEVTSPSTTRESEMMLKAKHARQRHVIDPLMKKLRDKVQRQRDKIDKERHKEIRRMDKLKKLEMLLGAKKKGKLSDRAIGVELDLVSSTTSTVMTTDSSTLMDTESTLTLDNSVHSNIDTTSKDSSTDVYVISPTLQKKRSDDTPMTRHRGTSAHYVEVMDDNDSSIFQKPARSKSGKSAKTKSGKVKINDDQRDKKVLSKKHRNKENVEWFLSQMDVGSYEEDLVKSKKTSRSPVSHRMKNVGTMFPSPVTVSLPARHKKSKKIYMVSEGVQTSPYVPHHSDRNVIPVPLMSPEVRKKRDKSPSLSSSPARSSSRSPVRLMTYKPPTRYRSPTSSPSRTVSFNTSTSPARSRSLEKKGKKRSPVHEILPDDQTYQTKIVPPPKSKMFTPETPEDTCIAKLKDSPNRGIAWYIPAAESKPWRKPLREQQAYAVAKEPWQPKSIQLADWKAMNSGELFNNDASRDTKFDLDPKGQAIGDLETSDEENIDPFSKPLTKMSLQEAFQAYKQATISHLRERQKRVKFASQERQLQDYLQHERNTIFTDNKSAKDPNLDAHPYSENLHKPKRRTISKEEMKALTKRLYKKLPEVVTMKQIKKREEDYSLNRLKARVFNRKLQTHVLKKAKT